MQGELVGVFRETDLCDGLLAGGRCLEHSFNSNANSCNSFELTETSGSGSLSDDFDFMNALRVSRAVTRLTV